ncbi:MAG: 1-acyl-sn-glycerol-3-phosphate acyltransferase [Bacteroidetes bacterium]|nr:1-acyl-sn-glycerol-3-phosphate acyltransferase [Bacteroidota bacterium]
MINQKTYKKFIDIEDVLNSKSKIIKKITPGFVFRIFRKILHEEEINQAIENNRSKYGPDFAKAIIDEFGARISIKGQIDISQKSRLIMVSNHPLGGLDGLALISIIGKIRSDLKFIVNDLLLNVENLRSIFLPVNKVGSSPKDALKVINDAFTSDHLLLSFPFGLVSRRKKGIIHDLEWKKSFITKAKQTKRDIIPVHIDGRNSNFFYRLANLRTFLGIKLNIEMFFLVNEMYKQKNQNITITFGKPIPISTFNNKYSESEWAEKLRKFVYELPSDPNKSFIQ